MRAGRGRAAQCPVNNSAIASPTEIGFVSMCVNMCVLDSEAKLLLPGATQEILETVALHHFLELEV